VKCMNVSSDNIALSDSTCRYHRRNHLNWCRLYHPETRHISRHNNYVLTEVLRWAHSQSEREPIHPNRSVPQSLKFTVITIIPQVPQADKSISRMGLLNPTPLQHPRNATHIQTWWPLNCRSTPLDLFCRPRADSLGFGLANSDRLAATPC
jgi:hypothetical protein